MLEYSETVTIGGPPMEVPEGTRYVWYLHEEMIGPSTVVDKAFVQQIVDASNEMTRLDTDRVRGYIMAVSFRYNGDNVVHFWFEADDPPSSEQLYAEHMRQWK